jgi:hypothetical protein
MQNYSKSSESISLRNTFLGFLLVMRKECIPQNLLLLGKQNILIHYGGFEKRNLFCIGLSGLLRYDQLFFIGRQNQTRKKRKTFYDSLLSVT